MLGNKNKIIKWNYNNCLFLLKMISKIIIYRHIFRAPSLADVTIKGGFLLLY
jgi:hypothetical protein